MRSLSQYLIVNSSVTNLDLINCSIGPLGCEFIGNIFGAGSRNFISKLKLDYNDIGDKGMEMLAAGLRLNTTLNIISLAYCNISQDAARFLLEIVINQKTAIKDINLQGNHLRNYGVTVFFRGLTVNNSVENVDLTDNQFGEEEGVIEALKNLIIRSKTLKTLNFTYNGFYEEGARKLFDFFNDLNTNELADAISLASIKLPEKIPDDLLKAIDKAIKDNKKKKSKAKSKKKGKKKGKKKA